MQLIEITMKLLKQMNMLRNYLENTIFYNLNNISFDMEDGNSIDYAYLS